jgi:hypothetical protein
LLQSVIYHLDSRYKTKLDHLVPLSAAAMAVLEQLPRIGRADFVFTVSGRVPISTTAQLESCVLPADFGDRGLGFVEAVIDAAVRGGTSPAETNTTSRPPATCSQ